MLSRAAGLDVHKLEITATVRLCGAPGGEPTCETRTFSALASGLAALVAWLTGHRVEAAAIEATGVYWQAPWNALAHAGSKPQLLNAQQVRQLRGRKTDVEDSRWLARVCQFGLGRPGFVPPEAFRDLRNLSRHRRSLVAQRSRLRNQVQKILDRSGVRIGGVLSDVFGSNGRRILDGLLAQLAPADILAALSGHVRAKLGQLGDALSLTLNDTDRYLLADLIHGHDDLARRVAACDRRIDEALEPCAEPCRLLETIPGIDHTSACALLTEIGPDMSVFGDARHLAAWAGLCPGNNESAGKRRFGHTRHGSRTVRAVLVECAHGASRTRHCQFQTYHKALTVRRGYKRALVATAHKLLRCIFAVLRDGTPCRDPATDYEELLVKRNAPRWLRKLREFDILVRNDDGAFSVHWPAPQTARTTPVH